MIVLELVYWIIRNTHEQLMSIKDDYIITKWFFDCVCTWNYIIFLFKNEHISGNFPFIRGKELYNFCTSFSLMDHLAADDPWYKNWNSLQFILNIILFYIIILLLLFLIWCVTSYSEICMCRKIDVLIYIFIYSFRFN